MKNIKNNFYVFFQIKFIASKFYLFPNTIVEYWNRFSIKNKYSYKFIETKFYRISLDKERTIFTSNAKWKTYVDSDAH